MIPHPDELHPYLLSNWMELIQGFTKKCLIVANLPYNIYIYNIFGVGEISPVVGRFPGRRCLPR